jgi:thiamine-phosphate pyrophosphorylase
VPGSLTLPRLYAILDGDLALARGLDPGDVFDIWADAGITLVQLRAKHWPTGKLLNLARTLAERARRHGVTLIVNDRADIARLARADGVHVGQDDLAPSDVRRVAGAAMLVGLSTHTDGQVRDAAAQPLDYLAIGPVFGTTTKERADAAVGTEGVRRAVAIAADRHVPVVAIGGITLDRAEAVLTAGAQSVAVIADLLAGDPRRRARAFVTALGA